MKFIAPFCILLLVTLNSTAKAQLLQYPESVVYDQANNRYLVSNWDSGHLVQIDSLGEQSYFVPSAQCYAGLWIVGDEVYAAAKSQGVRGYNLFTGEQVMNLAIPGTLLLNDIVSDDTGNLYLSDPQAHKIIRVNISTHEISTFVESGINVPNGLCFDRAHNRLIVVSSRANSPVQAISLEDSSVTTIINTTIDIMDGITRDETGNYYISNWGDSRVYRYDSLFTIPPEVFSTHDEQPADIFYNRTNSMLAVPIFYNHRVDFIDVTQSGIAYDDSHPLPAASILNQNYPNPFNTETSISFSLSVPGHVNLDIYDILGRKVTTLVSQYKPAGEYTINWQAENYVTGIYMARLSTCNNTQSINLSLLK